MPEFDALRDSQRSLLRQMLATTGLKPTPFARRAGVDPTTLTRFLNSRDVTHLLSAGTLAKCSTASGIAVPVGIMAAAPGDPDLDPERLRLAMSIALDPAGNVTPMDLNTAELTALAYDTLEDIQAEEGGLSESSLSTVRVIVRRQRRRLRSRRGPSRG